MDSSFKLWEDLIALAKEVRGGEASVEAWQPKNGKLFGNTLVMTLR